jgi:hypothetical protein
MEQLHAVIQGMGGLHDIYSGSAQEHARVGPLIHLMREANAARVQAQCRARDHPNEHPHLRRSARSCRQNSMAGGLASTVRSRS